MSASSLHHVLASPAIVAQCSSIPSYRSTMLATTTPWMDLSRSSLTLSYSPKSFPTTIAAGSHHQGLDSPNCEIKSRKRRGGAAASKKSNSTKWPLIELKSNLQICGLIDFDIFTIHNLFTSAESRAFVKAAELIGFTHQGSLGSRKGEAYRDNDRISVNDPVLADTIWESGLDKLFSDIKIRGKVAVGLNPNIRFYRYKVGQRFGRHIDESNDLGGGKHTYYTLLIYLSGNHKPGAKKEINIPNNTSSEPLVGGETVFYGSRNRLIAEVAPMEGMALLHIHGDECMLHEARNVTKGVKYVFRSDVVFA